MLERAGQGAALAAALAMAGCTEGRTVWDDLARSAEASRALQLAWEVPVLEVTPELYADMQEAAAENVDDGELEEFVATWGRMGFFDPSLDLRPIFAASSSVWVAGAYSPTLKRILIVGEPGDDVVVHEMVHALQDQHFHLGRFADTETTDARATRRAVIEGDASLAQGRFVLRSKGADLDDLDWTKLFDSLKTQAASFLDTSPYPAFFAAGPALRYTYGTIFCAHNLTGAHPDHPYATRDTPFDWSREDELFTVRTPATTQEILRAGPVEDPIAVGLDDVPESLADKLTALDWDTLGAWYTFMLFYPTFPTENRLAKVSLVEETWRGDRVLFVKDAATGEVGVVWASAWVDETFAQNAVARMQQVHGFSPIDGSDYEGWAGDGERLWIEQRGPRAVFLKNVAPEHTQALVDAAIGPVIKPTSASGPASFLPRSTGRPRSRPSLAAWTERLSRDVAPPRELR